MKNIIIKMGSVVDEDVDAIVCSANNWLVLGSSVAGEIDAMDGGGVQVECNEIIKSNGGALEIGIAVSTSAGTLADVKTNLRIIIHAIGMGYVAKINNGAEDRILATPESVSKAVTNTLKIAEKEQIHSIAFPLMCARSGYNTLDDVDGPRIMLETMVQAITSFCEINNCVLEVTICTGDVST